MDLSFGQWEDFTHLYWIEPADNNSFSIAPQSRATIELSVSKPKKAGALRAEGSLSEGGTKDLTAAQGIDDFVEVIVAEGWVALRENGDLVTSKQGVEGITGVRRLLPGLRGNFGWIDRNGRLNIRGNNPGSSAGVRNIPASVREADIVDACWQSGAALALASDGTAFFWGECYEGDFRDRPQWAVPPNEALRDVIDIAQGNGFFATVTSDHQLHLWGYAEWQTREADVERHRKSHGEVTNVESGHTSIRVLTRDGKVFSLAAGFNRPSSGGLIAEKAVAILQGIVLPEGSERWGWDLPNKVPVPFPEFDGLEPSQFAARAIDNDSRISGSIWIESTDSAEDATNSAAREQANERGGKLNLTPAIVKLKETGGRLRLWTPQAPPTSWNLEKAEGIDDANDILEFYPSGWTINRSSGKSVSTKPFFNEIAGLRWCSGRYGMTSDGQLVGKFEEAPVIERVRSQWSGVALIDESVLLSLEGKPYVAPGGSIKWEDYPGYEKIRRRLLGVEGATHVTFGGSSGGGAILKDGKPLCWDLNHPEGIIGAPGEVGNLVDLVAQQRFWTGLSDSGEVWVWNEAGLCQGTNAKHLQPPRDLGPVFAIRAASDAVAAQMGDGRWRAWGLGPSLNSYLKSLINEAGPLIDLEFARFHSHPGDSMLWIEPVGD